MIADRRDSAGGLNTPPGMRYCMAATNWRRTLTYLTGDRCGPRDDTRLTARTRVLRRAILFTTAIIGVSVTVPAHGQASPPPTLRYTPECDIRRGSALLQDEMGSYLLHSTMRPGVRYLDTELRQRLEARSLSLSMAMLVRDLFDDHPAPTRLPAKDLTLAYADELQALRQARRLASAGESKAFWSAESRRSAVYESHCQIGN